MTKAKTMQASKKFRNLWPCQKFRASVGCGGTMTAAAVVAVVPSFDSLHCSVESASQVLVTLCAIDPQISQVLQQIADG